MTRHAPRRPRAAWAFGVLALGLGLWVAGERLPPATPELRNPAFDAPDTGRGAVPGWTARGERYGEARLVTSPVVSAPAALELRARGPGSTGEQSFMLYQVLDPARWRGRRVRFGARVRGAGAGVNLVLYTPQKQANDFDPQVEHSEFRARSAVLDVPAAASFLSFGIQLFGPAGARAYVDDAFVRAEDSGPAPAPAPSPASGPAPLAEARVEIDAGQERRRLDERVFGQHLEWVADGNGLLERTEPRLRREVLERLQALRVPLFRFPGGIHADYYDWRLGDGPSARRGESLNVFTQRRERHRFGTPELAELLRATGAAALITANYGQGSAQQAGAWAAALRSQGVDARYWEVGNEIYLSGPRATGPNGSAIYQAPERYAADFGAFRAAIHAELPQAFVGAIAHLDDGAFPLAPADNRDWSERMLASLRERPDFLAVHNAYAPVIVDGSQDFASAAGRERVYRALYAAPEQTRENLAALVALVDRVAPRLRGSPLAVTEFGPLFGLSAKPEEHAVYVDQSRTLAAAVYVAALLDLFTGDARVMLACYTNPVHRWYGSLLTDTDEGLVTTPSWHAFAFYRALEPRVLASRVHAPAFDAPQVGLVRARRGVSELLARASLSDDGRRLTAVLVNRSQTRTLDTRVTLAGFSARRSECRVLTAASPAAVAGPRLSASTQAVAALEPQPLACEGTRELRLRLPPHSIVSLAAVGSGPPVRPVRAMMGRGTSRAWPGPAAGRREP